MMDQRDGDVVAKDFTNTLNILKGNCATNDFTNTILNSSTMMVITLNKCRATMTVLPSPIRFCTKAHEP